MPRILAKIVNLAAKRTETLTGKTWTDNDSNTRYAADVIAHFEDAAGKVPGDVGYVGPVVQSGASKIITPAITVSADAYAAGKCVGGKLTLTDAVRVSGGSGVLQNITVLDASATEPAFEILIFNADPTAATLTDQAAIALSTDVAKVIHRIPVYTSDYTTVAGVSIADVNVGKVVQAVGSDNLYACIAATAAHDFAATTDIKMHFGFLQD